MMKKRIILSISAIALMGLITGCGSSSSSSNNNETSTTPTQVPQKAVKAVDGYIIGANVCDANGVCATTDANGTAKASFGDTVLTANGGYIDVNDNHKIDSNEDIALPDTFTLKTPAGKNVISPITDLIANGANPAKLAEVLGVDENTLYEDPIATNNIDLAKAVQIVYAVKVDKKESDFVSKINNYNAQTENNTTSSAQTSNTSTSSALPEFKAVGSVNGNIDVFANLALSVVSDEAKNLITAVIDSNVTDVNKLEESIASDKKTLLETSETASVNTNTTVETNNTQEVNTTTSTQTNSNSSALPQF